MFLKIFEVNFSVQNESLEKASNDRITQGIKISYRHKRSLYIINRRSNNPHMRAHYNKYCKILSKVIKEAKRQHFCRLIEKADNKIKPAWNIIKQESGNCNKWNRYYQFL
jgi:regulatory protein YycH of two-component signal transduction system YycFG